MAMWHRGRFQQGVTFDRDDHALFAGSPVPRRRKFQLITSVACDDASAWSVSYSAKANDTTYYRSGVQSVKVTMNASDTKTTASLYRTFSAADYTRNSKNPVVFCRFYIHDGTGASAASKLTTVGLTLVTSSGNSFSTNLAYDASGLLPGWYQVCIGASEFGQSGSPNWASQTGIYFNLTSLGADDTPSVTLDTIQFLEPLAAGLVIVAFDDGYDDHLACARYMEALGLPGTFAIITRAVGLTNYLTLANLKEIAWEHSAGHLLVNHTSSAGQWVSDALSAATFEQNIADGKKWLCQNGFPDGADILVVPGGGQNLVAADMDRVWKHCSLIRSTDRTHDNAHRGGGRHYAAWPRIWNTTAGTSDGIDTTMTTRYGYAKADGTIAILYFHEFTEANLTKFKALMDVVAADRNAGDIEVGTLADLRAY